MKAQKADLDELVQVRLGIFAKTFEGTDPALVLDQVAATGFSATQYNMACSGLPSMPDHIPEGAAEAVAHAGHHHAT